ncbi:DNA-3-methyladenine glycosylase 2 family protein [Actinomycetospora sp. TBRC 11914]|uniref:DNA-3-methyladenine glycosylase 2 family protein n=1 Tax=Actinomycetospora sp. TBRC 11914 TaxID=2729387 RepID=UPI00145D4C06|nr:DNA-3-methyladenine glycosylase 2 family protein [Actinomycetospora sp. TBRC 11914]NMO90868.1 DNA-3-methyladenine glycosylase 2 family protein [Actinomycetospora sp. TBRC 11914]
MTLTAVASKASLLASSGRKAAPSAPTRTSTPAPTSTHHVLHPAGPFSLDLARTAVMAWAPVSRFARDAARPLVLAAIADDDLRPVAFALTQGAVDGPVALEVLGTGDPDAARAQAARLVSLDHDATGLADVATRDPAVGALLARRHGRRPTLFPSPYEAAAWAVISPRIGKARAATLTRRLATDHGTTLHLAGESVATFPTPQRLLTLDEVPGLPAEKVRRLHGVARAALDGDLDIHRLQALGPDGARAALRRIRGIGEFWSSGIWLRACGVVDEWPDEPRATALLARLHGREPTDYDDPATLAAATAPLAPYRTWVAFALRMGDA